MLLLNHLHCSHFIICTPITSSHTLLLNHPNTGITTSHITSHTLLLNSHKHYCYYVTYCFTTYTALTSSHALLLPPHIPCPYFITCAPPTSSHAMLVLHHMHCSCSNTCADLTSSQALLFHHMRCYHCFTCTVWPAGIEPTTTDLDFSSTPKETELTAGIEPTITDSFFFFDAKRKRKEKSRRRRQNTLAITASVATIDCDNCCFPPHTNVSTSHRFTNP